MLRLLFGENHQGFIFDHRMEPSHFVIRRKQALAHGIEPQYRVLYCGHGVALLPEYHTGSVEQKPVIPGIEKLKSRWVLFSDQGQNLRQIGRFVSYVTRNIMLIFSHGTSMYHDFFPFGIQFACKFKFKRAV